MPRGGKRNGAGRPKGGANVLTTEAREMILQAVERLGGIDWLVEQGEKNPTALMSLYGKCVPQAREHKHEGLAPLLLTERNFATGIVGQSDDDDSERTRTTH